MQRSVTHPSEDQLTLDAQFTISQNERLDAMDFEQMTNALLSSSWGLKLVLPSCSPRCQPPLPSATQAQWPGLGVQVNILNMWKKSVKVKVPIQFSL